MIYLCNLAHNTILVTLCANNQFLFYKKKTERFYRQTKLITNCILSMMKLHVLTCCTTLYLLGNYYSVSYFPPHIIVMIYHRNRSNHPFISIMCSWNFVLFLVLKQKHFRDLLQMERNISCSSDCNDVYFLF